MARTSVIIFGFTTFFCTTSLFVLNVSAMQQPKIGDHHAALQAYRKNRDKILEMLVDEHIVMQTEAQKDALLIQSRNAFTQVAKAHATGEWVSKTQSLLLCGVVGARSLYKWYTNSLAVSDCASETRLLSVSVFCCLDSCKRRGDVASCEDAIMTIDAVIRQKSGLNHPHQD